jgi:hypothetical protein
MRKSVLPLAILALVAASPAAACDLEGMGFTRFNPLAHLAAAAHGTPQPTPVAAEAASDPKADQGAIAPEAASVASTPAYAPSTEPHPDDLAEAAAMFW